MFACSQSFRCVPLHPPPPDKSVGLGRAVAAAAVAKILDRVLVSFSPPFLFLSSLFWLSLFTIISRWRRANSPPHLFSIPTVYSSGISRATSSSYTHSKGRFSTLVRSLALDELRAAVLRARGLRAFFTAKHILSAPTQEPRRLLSRVTPSRPHFRVRTSVIFSRSSRHPVAPRPNSQSSAATLPSGRIRATCSSVLFSSGGLVPNETVRRSIICPHCPQDHMRGQAVDSIITRSCTSRLVHSVPRISSRAEQLARDPALIVDPLFSGVVLGQRPDETNHQ